MKVIWKTAWSFYTLFIHYMYACVYIVFVIMYSDPKDEDMQVLTETYLSCSAAVDFIYLF